MVRRVVGAVAAASALSAHAMMIPPNVQSMDDDSGALAMFNSNWRAVKLPCPECVIPTPKTEIKEDSDEFDAPVFIMGGANSLLVNITSILDGHAIGLPNDYPLYPPLASFDKGAVDMVRSDVSLTDLAKSNDNRHAVKVSADSALISEKASPDGGAFIRIKYHIISVDNHPVTVDAIDIACFKRDDGELILVSADPVPSPTTIFDSLPAPFPHDGEAPPPPPPHHGAPEKQPCSLPPVLCQWRDFVESKMDQLSHSMPKHFGKRPGCHGKGKGKGKGMHKGHKGHKEHDRPLVWTDDEGTVHLPSHNRPPHHMGHPAMHEGRPHFRGHHRHHHHSAFHGMVRGFLMVLIPIFSGICMGIAISILGTIIGRLITFIWVRFVRGGQRGYASVQLSEEEAEAAEATKEHDEPLPVYEDAAPAYEEKEVK